MKNAAFSRRSFVAGTAATGALAAAAAPVASLAAEAARSSAGDAGGPKAASTSTSFTYSATPHWLGEKPEVAEADIAETVESDFVIVGGGNAGLMCACALTEAAAGAASVAVIEAQAQDSIFYWGNHDIANLNSKWGLEHGAMQVDPIEFLQEWQKRNINRTDARLVKLFCDNSGELIDWLMANMDESITSGANIPYLGGNTKFYENGGDIHGFKTWISTCNIPGIGGEGGYPKLVAAAEAAGATWYWEHTGVVLEQDADGRVTGVIAKDASGAYKRFAAAKALVLACGDYGADPAMYAALQDDMREMWQARGLDPADMHCIFGRDGSGDRMGMWAGAVMDPGPHAKNSPSVMMYGSDVYQDNELKWGAGWDNGANPEGTSWFCVSAQDGRRFCDEGVMGIFGQLHRVERRPAGKYYFVWDSKWREYLSAQPPEHFMPSSDEKTLATWEARLQTWIDGGADGEPRTDGGTTCCWAAQSLDELLDYMGVEGEVKQNMLDEIERYNGFCATGVDEDFGKDARLLMAIDEPPFFGMYSISEKPTTGQNTLNGLVINERQQCTDASGTPIPGLYATGNNSGGRFAAQYSTPTAGMTLGMAMTLGRVLGKQLAELA